MGNALSPRVRELIVRFDPAAECAETVTDFCHRLGVSRASFYRVRQRADARGMAAALVPDSRAPITPARRYGQFTVAAVGQVRRELASEGMDHGPWSIAFRMFQLEIEPLPSRATIARILREQGWSRQSPRKRPRASWRRFRRELANELWQLDGVEWRLPGTGLVTIYQVIDDHSRVCVALQARAGGESSPAAVEVLQHAFARWGQPSSVLSDNAMAFNQHRRGRLSHTELWLAGLGIRPISGQVAHPQTQGKVERSHQPLLAWLAAHPAETLEQLQGELDRFQDWYNARRQHQGLGIRITPLMAWDASAKAAPQPHPIPHDLLLAHRRQPPPPTTSGVGERSVGDNALVTWKGYKVRLGQDMLHTHVGIIQTSHALEIYDTDGVLHALIPWPPPTKYTSATQPPLRQAPVIDRRTTAYKLSQKS